LGKQKLRDLRHSPSRHVACGRDSVPRGPTRGRRRDRRACQRDRPDTSARRV